ncbi:MAG: hypothetical protein AAGI07_01445 [Bacteroidota bacterium]
MKLKRTNLITILILGLFYHGASSQGGNKQYPVPPKLEVQGKYLHSLIKDGKNSEVAQWASNHKKKAIYQLFNTTSFEAILAEGDYGFLLEEKDTIQMNQYEREKVTFTCGSCKIKNKLKVSGPDEFILTQIEFPIEKKLKPGSYEMTYWQNRVQQIHLPFTVKENSKNIIRIKD